MIEKLDIKNGGVEDLLNCIKKTNEIIDIIYDMQLAISSLDPDSDWYDGNHIADTSKKVDIGELAHLQKENSDLKDEVELLQKKLEIAVDALNTIKGKHDPRCAVYHIDEKTAYDALEQITALEHKRM